MIFSYSPNCFNCACIVRLASAKWDFVMQGIEIQVDSTETAWMIPNYTIGFVHLSNSNGLERAMHGGVREIIKCAALPPKEGDGLGAAAGQAASGLQIANRVTAIGHAIWLMSRSPLHKHLMVTDIEWLLMPPIMLNQFHMWQRSRPPPWLCLMGLVWRRAGRAHCQQRNSGA